MVLLLLPQQAVGYLASFHMVDTAQTVELEHENIHAQGDQDPHSHDFKTSEGEHRHSPNAPLHSHAKDLNGNSAPASVAPSFKIARLEIDSILVKVKDSPDALMSNSHEKALIRPPIA